MARNFAGDGLMRLIKKVNCIIFGCYFFTFTDSIYIARSGNSELRRHNLCAEPHIRKMYDRRL